MDPFTIYVKALYDDLATFKYTVKQLHLKK